MRPRLSLKARGLQWLSQREHSRSELRRKLLAHLKKEQRELQRAPPAEEARPAGATVTIGEGGDAVFPTRHRNDHASALQDPERLEPADLEAQVDEALDWLQSQHHLSDERFVESRLHVRAPRFGNRRIQQELAQHGVTLSVEDRQALKDSEHERAVAVWRRKFGQGSGDVADAAARAKQARFLSARGFSAEVIRRVLKTSHTD